MRRLAILTVLTACLVGLGGGEGQAAPAQDLTPNSCDGKSAAFHKKRAFKLINKGYALSRWQDRTPITDSERRSLKDHKFCLKRSKARASIADYRASKASRFRSYRRIRLLTPYYGGGSWWAIPWYVVACESGGDWGAVNPSSGAFSPYQLLPSTYAGVCKRCDRSREDIHLAASRVWARSGGSEWVCA